MPILVKNQNYINLEDMIFDYNKEKHLKDKSKNFCLICNDFNEALSKNIFYQLPEILIIYPGRKKRNKIQYYNKFWRKIEYKIKWSFRHQNRNV